MAGYMFFDTFYPDVKGIYYERNKYSGNLEFCGLLTNDGIEACSSEDEKAFLEKDFPELPVLSIKKDVVPQVNDYFVRLFLQPPFCTNGSINRIEWEKYLSADKIDEIEEMVYGSDSNKGKDGACNFPAYGVNEFALMFSQFTSQENLEREKLSLLKNTTFLTRMLSYLCKEKYHADWDTCPLTAEEAKAMGWEVISGRINYLKDDRANVEIPSSINHSKVTTIDNSFYGYQGCKIQTLTIPESIEMIALSEVICPCLKKITSRSPYYRVENDRYLIRNEDNRLVFVAGDGLTEAKIPAGVETIGVSCFCNTKIETVEIPDSVKEIYRNAFSDCSNLKSVEMPDTVEYLGSGVFFNCNSLTAIHLSNSIKALCAEAFKNCKDLEEISLPDKLEIIYEECFCGCSKLKTVQIPQSVKTIGSDAFSEVLHVEYHGKCRSKTHWGALFFN